MQRLFQVAGTRNLKKNYQQIKGYSHMSKLLWYNQTIIPDESAAGGLDALLSVGCERDIGAAGVSAIQRPLCLTMTYEKDPGCCHDYQESLCLAHKFTNTTYSFSIQIPWRAG
jgi:hypothetical protein